MPRPNYNCKTINTKCSKCGGRALDQSSSKRTQENARKLFGSPIPNSCVPDEDGTLRCPYASK